MVSVARLEQPPHSVIVVESFFHDLPRPLPFRASSQLVEAQGSDNPGGAHSM
jgi:hypothetical protein